MIARAIAVYILEEKISLEALAGWAEIPLPRLRLLLDEGGEMTIEEYLRVCEALELDYTFFFERRDRGATV